MKYRVFKKEYADAGKLDENLICMINISMQTDKNIADYEKLFE